MIRQSFLSTCALVAAATAIIPLSTSWADSGDEVTITLVGDVGLNRSGQPVEPDGVRRGEFQTWAETTSLIDSAINGDLNFMNVETVVTDRNDLVPDLKEQRAPFNFRTHPNGLRYLVSRGFNLLSLANNHSMDYGVAGLKETLKHVGDLEREHLAVAAGIGMNAEEASRPKRVDVKGSEIAFAATGIVTNDLERHRAGPNTPGQNSYRFDDDYAEVLRRLVATPADYRILSIHYGVEGRVRADAKQFADYRELAAKKDGIDLVVGHHAHVVRGVEIAGQSLIFYGLGNFLHQGTADITRKGICRDHGLMARVHLKKQADGKLKLRAVEAIPVTDTHWRPRQVTGEDGAARIHALNYLDANLGAGSNGIAFTPKPDGTGLYCLPGAERDGGKIGALCAAYRPAPPIPADLMGDIANSCSR
ncbi:MAG: CapA family protein [Hyphomicrobium sp.]|jgi:poly-gamma-glutamate synthesis protein (capsule biosynthesis protein)